MPSQACFNQQDTKFAGHYDAGRNLLALNGGSFIQSASVLVLAVLDVWVCCSQLGRRIPLLVGAVDSCVTDHLTTDVANDSFRNGRGSYSTHLFSLVEKTTHAKLRRNAIASARLGKVASIFAPVLNRT
jgi:hypothetical protein